MKQLKWGILAFFLLMVSGINAQIENEIKSYVDSSEVLINNGRRLLLQKVHEKDTKKASEIFNYLKDKAAYNDCAAFSYTEELYISCLISDWGNFFILAENIRDHVGDKPCIANAYAISGDLYKEIAGETEDIYQSALKEDISTEDKDMLDIYLYLLKTGRSDDIYDKKVKEFNKKYPASRYRNFFSYYMPEVSKPANMSFYMGTSIVFPQGKLGSNIESGPTFHMGFDYNFNRVYVGIQISGGNLKLKNGFSASNSYSNYSFSPGDKFNYFDGGLYAGYSVIANPHVRISPFISIGGISLESTLYSDSRDDDKELQLFNSFGYGPGLHSELKLFSYHSSGSSGFVSLRLDAGYNFIAKQTYTDFKGNMPYLRMALAWGIGNF